MPSESGPHRKYYELNDTGRSLLEAQTKTWLAFADTMTHLLELDGAPA